MVRQEPQASHGDGSEASSAREQRWEDLPWNVLPKSPAPSSSLGSQALMNLYQAAGTQKQCSVVMATREMGAAWSIWKERDLLCYF